MTPLSTVILRLVIFVMSVWVFSLLSLLFFFFFLPFGNYFNLCITTPFLWWDVPMVWWCQSSWCLVESLNPKMNQSLQFSPFASPNKDLFELWEHICVLASVQACNDLCLLLYWLSPAPSIRSHAVHRSSV